MLARNRWFVAVALAYALLGGLLGLCWLAVPAAMPALALRAHAHLMLVGFVGMMIFGIGLHVLPRFTGRPLYSERLADAQFAAANLVFSGLGGDATRDAQGVLLYVYVDGTKANDKAIAFIDFTSDITKYATQITVPWDAQGILQFAQA